MRYVRGMFVLWLMILLHVSFLSGCGYQPSSKFARDVVGDSVSIKVIISGIDPQNTVLIKDALDVAVINSFRTALTDKEHAETHLTISLKSVGYTPIQFDSNGYVVGYETTITLHVDREHAGITKGYDVLGYYNFTIEPNAIISDQIRYDAIQNSATKALAAFVAKVSAQGARSDKGK